MGVLDQKVSVKEVLGFYYLFTFQVLYVYVEQKN